MSSLREVAGRRALDEEPGGVDGENGARMGHQTRLEAPLCRFVATFCVKGPWSSGPSPFDHMPNPDLTEGGAAPPGLAAGRERRRTHPWRNVATTSSHRNRWAA